MYIFKAQHISKKFQDTPILHNISFELSNQNNIIGLIGPNGSGKTTLLKCLSGYLESTYSVLEVYPHISLAQNPDLYQENISFVPDIDSISPFLTGREFLNLVIDMRKLYSPRIQKRLHLLCDYFDISNDLDRLMKEYSHGMIKKISLIAGFLPSAKVLLLDEPFNGLDPEMITLTKNLIRQYAIGDKACLLSSHYLQGIEELCSSIIVLDKGHIHYKGTVNSFIQQYQTKNLETSWIQYLGISDEKNELIQKIIDCN
jgi:ABC-2 type transport system ATP-binding protein